MKTKIPKCPKCGEEVKMLIANENNAVTYKAYMNNEDIEYDEIDSITSPKGTIFSCPHCDKKLFNDEDDAKGFLLGSKIEKGNKFYKVVEK